MTAAMLLRSALRCMSVPQASQRARRFPLRPAEFDAEARADRQGRTADLLCRLDFLILDELGYLPFAQTGGQLLFHLISRLY